MGLGRGGPSLDSNTDMEMDTAAQPRVRRGSPQAADTNSHMHPADAQGSWVWEDGTGRWVGAGADGAEREYRGLQV